ncbi:hypothetical protein LCGC14_0607530 [marine sediment metagenome]|uniref:Uncharacterized protein n=1 Tax=marine sediment metagenome TaxID=412755 RepID=A0A0F9RSV5_9ZZZZ
MKPKVSDEEIIHSYTQTGNIWKTGEAVGLCGQSVWERLKKLGIQLSIRHWTADEIEGLRQLYSVGSDEPIYLTRYANSIGRRKSDVCRKAKELGLATSYSRKKSPEYCKALGIRTREWIKQHGLPRGYREIRVCPICGKFFEVPSSAKQVCCSYSCATRKRFKGVNMYSRSKGGKREDLDGQYFRSNYEANYARFLNFLMANGEPIEKWEFEPDTFEFKKIKKGTRFYTPDFKIYYKDEHIEYHEVKGWDYTKGITQRKRFAKYFPHLKLLVVDGDFFKDIKRKGMDKLIPYWE